MSKYNLDQIQSDVEKTKTSIVKYFNNQGKIPTIEDILSIFGLTIAKTVKVDELNSKLKNDILEIIPEKKIDEEIVYNFKNPKKIGCSKVQLVKTEKSYKLEITANGITNTILPTHKHVTLYRNTIDSLRYHGNAIKTFMWGKDENGNIVCLKIIYDGVDVLEILYVE